MVGGYRDYGTRTMRLGRAIAKFGRPLVLVAVLAALLTGLFGYIEPLRTDLASEVNALQREARNLRDRLRNLANEVEALERNREQYEKLLEHGFVAPQDRLRAARILDELRETYRLSTINYEITPEQVINDPVARNSGFEIVSTTVSVTMQGFLDTDLVRLAHAVVTAMPGQITLRSLSLRRSGAVTRDGLIAISRGNPAALVDGKLNFSWRTLRPLEQKGKKKK